MHGVLFSRLNRNNNFNFRHPRLKTSKNTTDTSESKEKPFFTAQKDQ